MKIVCHTIDSPFQATETRVYVGVPSNVADAEPLTTIFVLPVGRLDGQACGDAMAEVGQYLDLHPSPYLCVMPTFTHAPWYADHPTDPGARQERHFLEVVLPLIEQNYPVGQRREHRLLLGFSKSGWGAYSLLLRHPDVFEKAAAWDAPLGQDSPHKYGMSEIFADQRTLDQYNVWDLLKRSAERLQNETRLGLFGYGVFRGHVQATHYQMLKLGVRHVYQFGPRRDHHWESGWVPTALDFLTGATSTAAPPSS